MKLEDFDYVLPEQAVAQSPLDDRAGSRMLVLYREDRRWEDRMFRELPLFLKKGDCLVLNDSKVLPSRLFGRRAGWGQGDVEIFLLRPVSKDRQTWQALVRPGRRMRVGEKVVFSEEMSAEVTAQGEFGERTLRFDSQRHFDEVLEHLGHVPLPPYIKRKDTTEDRSRYQTTYARVPGSVAAPTAGLHFTPEVLEACQKAGAELAFVTLHVGLGTFQPLRNALVETAELHTEIFEISSEAARRINAAKRIVSAGTTAVRTIETALQKDEWKASSGETNLFIYPGFRFRGTGAMLTNFHLPRSSLLVLVSAFAGREFVLAAYRHAIAEGYRFYSYGDCMLIV